MSRTKQTRPTYLAQTLPGFEAIAGDEIVSRFDATLRGTRSVVEKNGIVLFDYDGDPADLMALRTIEDLFVLVATVNELPPAREALRLLEQAALRAPAIEPALAVARQIRPGRGGHGKLRFRVVSRQVGRAAYRRVDAQQAVERAIAQRPEHRWQLDEQGALEFWLTLLPAQDRGSDASEALLALRLSDERMRHREYQLEHLPASLRPSAAAALAWLTRPQDDDVFLDPMCGAGTILIERAHMGRYRQLLGGDEQPEAVAVALANIGPRYKPIEVREWDARKLPLDAGSVSALAVNLPFGRQVGSVEANRALYPAFLREAARVLRPGAPLVALTSDRQTFVENLRRTSKLARRSSYSVTVLGHPASVYVVERV